MAQIGTVDLGYATGIDNDEIGEAAYNTYLQQLDIIADLPLKSPSQPQTARDHDAILYPKEGKMP